MDFDNSWLAILLFLKDLNVNYSALRNKMNKKFFLHSIYVWLIFAFITVFFGAFREIFFIPVTGLNGNLARALLLPLAFFYILGITYIYLKKYNGSYSIKNLYVVGTLWFVLTILFEFGFGGLVMGHSLKKLLADYNIFEGKTWSLFLICVLTAPMIVNKYFLNSK